MVRGGEGGGIMKIVFKNIHMEKPTFNNARDEIYTISAVSIMGADIPGGA